MPENKKAMPVLPLTLTLSPQAGRGNYEFLPRPAMRGEGRGEGQILQPGSFQPSQSHTARPMTSSRSRPLSHGISSVNIVMHSFHEHGMRVMSVPQNVRSGPNASTICWVYLWML